MNSKNSIVRNIAKKKESKALSRYLREVKEQVKKEKVLGGTINQNETPTRYHKRDSMVV